MAFNDGYRKGLLSAGGILSIVAGVFLISSGVLAAVIVLGPTYRGGFIGGYIGGYILGDMFLWFLPFVPYLLEAWWQYFDVSFVTSLAIIGGCSGVLGIIALAGGISSIRGKSFGLSLAGAICALPSVPSGILAVIFVSLGKREFGAKA
jgi:hypothetical protein